MKIDLNEGFSQNSFKSYDVCVCGAGVAGITIALSLVRSGLSVALFEAGGEEYSDESQDVYDGEDIGIPYWGVETCRLRYLGGTSNHWAGRCRPLEAVDFTNRDYFDLPGWPINKSDLDPYLRSTLRILDLGEQSFATPEDPLWSSDAFKIDSFAKSPPTRFGEKYLEELSRSKGLDLFLNANVTDIRLGDNMDHVTNLMVTNYKNETFSFSGKRIVLAFGAIENARFLLNCDSQNSKGIGNQSDFVGRCFMEHFNIDVGRFIVDPETNFWEKNQSLAVMPTASFIQDQRVGNATLAFQSDSIPRLYGRTKELKRIIRDAACGSETLLELSRKLTHFNCPGDGLITTICEQSPNRDSRILLGKDRDKFGLRRVRLDWQINDLDRRTLSVLALESAKEIARLNLGRVQLSEYIMEGDLEGVLGFHCHHMGTTRMAASAEFGVVDRNSKIFRIDNLYVAGSSVFSTGGGTNPTFSIVQLSLRLADHLKSLS